MATYTSTQSGNFSSSSTWGGAGTPGDGDIFNVSVGHTVTIDSGISIPTNGYADSHVYGILQSQSGTSNTLRMNGRLYVDGGGTLHLRDGATIQINGSSAEQHGIWIENAASSNCIMEGSDGMPSTTLTSALTEDSTVIPVASASSFGVGEWIALFDNQTTVGATNDHAWQHTDEGFWIHDISGNNIYFRLFGGPNDVSITSASGSIITVTNSKVFRAGQILIFGTGSNRNIKTINAINYITHEITCDSAVTGSVVGEIAYITRIEKGHKSGDKVRKVATVTTTTKSSGATSIDVSNAAMFATNDEIWIEWKSEASSTSDYEGRYNVSTDGTSNADKTKYTVTSVSSNTINITPALKYNCVAESLVVRMSRNIVCETVATDGSDYAFFYAEAYTTDYSKKLILKDVYFKNWGNDDANTQTGVTVRGHCSTDSLPVTLTETIPARGRECWIEGIIMHGYPNTTHRNDWGGIFMFDNRYSKPRCCMVLNSNEGFGIYYEPGASIANCIASQCDEWGFRLEGISEWYEHAYLYASRCLYGFRVVNSNEAGLGSHDWICDGGSYSVMFYNAPAEVYRSRFSGTRFGLLSENCNAQLIYCKNIPLSGLPNVDAGTGTTQAGSYYIQRALRTSGKPGIKSIEHNYEIDSIALYGYNSESRWDNTESAWRFYRRYDADEQPALGECIYIPANTTVRVSALVKLAPSFSGTYPRLFAHDLISGIGENRVAATATDATKWTGKRYTSQYTSAAATDYEEKQITVVAKPWSRNYYIGVYSDNRNAAEGYWVKDMKVYFDTPYPTAASGFVNDVGLLFVKSGVQIRDSFTQQKRRWGG